MSLSFRIGVDQSSRYSVSLSGNKYNVAAKKCQKIYLSLLVIRCLNFINI